MSDHHPSPGRESAALSDVSSSAISGVAEDNRIKVVCRVRPPVSRETHGAKGLSTRCVAVGEDRRTVMLNSKPHGKSFTFDYAAGEDSTQEELFAEVGQPVTEACLEGYNGTIFCYGQTGSGKTFTTFGPGAAMENHLNPSDPKSYALRGLVPRVLEYLYASIGRKVEGGGGKVSYSCCCSFYEIFNEKVFDLVDDSNRDNPMGLTVREDTRKGVYVEGLMEEQVDGAEDACEILHQGFRNRHVGETAMNRESSRSHAVFTLVIQATEVVEEEGLTRSRVARFNLVDLAGSERQKDTQASGERLKEASNINKSLSTLGQVINALVEKSAGRYRHVHYRDSKLTFLLRNSLGGNSKTMLVAAISPADQNFGETLSTLKFAQRAKMIKNQAIKNEDTSGSFDALRREVTVLRHKLAAVQQQGASADDGFAAVPRAVVDAGENASGFSSVAVGGEVGDASAAASEELLANALRRARAAEEAHVGTRRRVESLLSAVEKGEKDALQLKMVIKFRDGTIAAQRKKDCDQERIAMAEENAHLRKQLEGGPHESTEVSKWRLRFKEAEARLAELTGDKSGDVKRLVWGVGDEERFRGELDEKVLSLMQENRELTEEAAAFEERLHHETRRAEKRRLSAANRADLETKKIVENALLSKLQEAQAQAERTEAALVASEDRVAALESDRAQQGAAVSALTKQLGDANRRVTEAVQDRDVRLSDLQSRIEGLSRDKERAVEDSGSEVASLELKLATAIKDNSELLRTNKALEEEADGLDQELERMENEKKAQEEASAVKRAESATAIAGLERRMQQQEEAHERESEEQQAEKRSVMQDLEAVTERLKSAEEAHKREVDEQQRRSNDLQERLVETRAQKEQLGGSLKQLQDDYETLSEQAQFSQGRAEELEVGLERAEEDGRKAVKAGVAHACVAQAALLRTQAELALTEEELEETSRRAQGEEFFKLVQEGLTARAERACAESERDIEVLVEELGVAEVYADGLGALLLEAEGVSERGGRDVDDARRVVEVMEAEARGSMVDVGLLGVVLREEEDAMVKVEELKQTVGDFQDDEDRLVEEVCGLQRVIVDMKDNEEDITTNLASVSTELEATKTELDDATRKNDAVSQALEAQEAATAGVRGELASANGRVAELEAAITETKMAAGAAAQRAEDLDAQLKKIRDSCFEYQARAVAAEGSVETLSADVARLKDDVKCRRSGLKRAFEDAAEAADAAIEEKRELSALLDASTETVLATERAIAAKGEEVVALEGALKDAGAELIAKEEVLSDAKTALEARNAELVKANDELAALEDAHKNRVAELSSKEEMLSDAEEALKAREEELVVVKEDLAALEDAHKNRGTELGAKEELLSDAETALQAREEEFVAVNGELAAMIARASGLEGKVARTREEAEGLGEKLASSKKDMTALKKEVTALKKELASTGRKLTAAVKTAGTAEEALERAEARSAEAEEGEAKLRVALEEGAEKSAGEIVAAKAALEAVEQRLSDEVAKTDGANKRAAEAESLNVDAEKLSAAMQQQVQDSAQEVAELQQEVRRAAEQLEESDAVRKELTGRIVDLKGEVKRLEGTLISGDERAGLQREVETIRLKLSETQQVVEVATSRSRELEEGMEAMRGQTEGYTAKVMELKDVNASLVGHKNNRQKIQQVQKLKDENNTLSRKVKQLDDVIFDIKRSGCGPGCVRHRANAAAAAAVAAGAASSPTMERSASVSSSSAESQQHSLSPSTRGGSKGGEGAGSAGKTYNLRRRGKAAELAAGAGGGAGAVVTRGRRMGLRDMTNAN